MTIFDASDITRCPRPMAHVGGASASVPNTWLATIPAHLVFGFETGEVTYVAERVSSTSIRLTFSRNVLDSPAVTMPELYSVSPDLPVLQVIPEYESGTINSVLLITQEQTTGVEYTVRMEILEGA